MYVCMGQAINESEKEILTPRDGGNIILLINSSWQIVHETKSRSYPDPLFWYVIIVSIIQKKERCVPRVISNSRWSNCGQETWDPERLSM